MSAADFPALVAAINMRSDPRASHCSASQQTEFTVYPSENEKCITYVEKKKSYKCPTIALHHLILFPSFTIGLTLWSLFLVPPLAAQYPTAQSATRKGPRHAELWNWWIRIANTMS